MLKEPFASTYVRLLAEYGDVVVASFVGHTHFDDYRMLRDAAGDVTGVEKIAPAISPIFGQNPGFLVFTYDKVSGVLADFTTMYLTNLEEAASPAAADWREEYAFAATYGQADFSPAAAEAMWKTLSEEGTADDTFRRLYNVSKGELSADNLDAYCRSAPASGSASSAATARASRRC
jgi:sphingomyelin phosphodiesterase acid-like 3